MSENHQYVIEKNIPIPPPRASSSGVAAAFRKLEVGDCVFIPKGNYKTLDGCAMGGHSSAKTIGIKIVTRRETKDGVEGVRFWRTA